MTPFVRRPPFRVMDGADFVTHSGEELVFVINGEMEVVFSDKSIKLQAGGSLYFDASVPHRSRSLGENLAEALVVVSRAGEAGD